MMLYGSPYRYSSAEASELPASTIKLDPPTARSQFPVIGNFLSDHVWKKGYGGCDLHRRVFGSHRSHSSIIHLFIVNDTKEYGKTIYKYFHWGMSVHLLSEGGELLLLPNH
ncbi:hypothetical protein DMB44_02625 [Thermoplasma sp. Kam2015]|nr:hypothetical protein DMB44_02625 [Thermoplasma sp. Kam2015]